MNFSWLHGGAQAPRIERIRHDVKIRTLRVTQVERLTPHMARVTFTGEELADFRSLAPDDRVKLSFTRAAGLESRRDYTVRRVGGDKKTRGRKVA
uniref:siderophore-interacting protein n=1 Tax=Burkholderia gladioli TaxID=28095 RepID=UPI0034DACD9C